MAIQAPYQYLTVAQCDELLTYLLPNAIYQDWIDEVIPSNTKVLSTYLASSVFETLQWKGRKLYDWQEKQFPRLYSGDKYRRYQDTLDLGERTDVGILPYEVAMGFAITAATIGYNEVNSLEDEDEFLTQGFSRISIGSLTVDIGKELSGDVGLIPDEAMTWIKPYAFISKSGKGMSEFRFI